MHILLRKLLRLHDISEEEQAALIAELGPPRRVTRGDDIIPDGGTPRRSTVLLSGTVCRYKILPGGKRHILAFQHPGDMTDLYSYVLKRTDHAVGALSDAEIADIGHDRIARLSERFPNLAYTFWRDTMIDMAILHHWAVGQGRETVERVADMLCETFVRLEVVGLAELGKPIPFHATQLDLADALGFSLVHINKTLAVLRRQRLIGRSSMGLEILDWDRLKRVARFDPSYLHLKPLPATRRAG